MKITNTLNIIALLLSLLLFVGCEKDVNDERLRVSPEIIEIGCEGGTVQVDIESTSGWKVVVPSNCTWVTSDRYESEVGHRQWIKLSISMNNTKSTRKATITISNRGQSRDIAITQSALSFSVTPESIDVGAEKTTKDIAINSKISWSAKTSDSWFSLSKNSGDAGSSKITVTIAKNTTGDTRTGHIEIYNHDYNLTKSVTITQEAATISVDSSSIEVGPEAATRNVTVTSDIDWMAKTSANWIILSKNSGYAGTTTLTINIGANTLTSSRSGYVEFYNSEYNVSKKVDINQIAFSPELSVSPNSFDVGAEATTKTVTIESNFSWTAKTSSSWIYVSKLSGSVGTTALTIEIDANTSTSSRSGYVELYNTEYNVSKRVDINQIAFSPELSVSPNSFDVGAEATTKTVTIESNFSWTAKTSSSWISVSKLSGSAGTTMLTVDIGANTLTSSRSGYVEFYNSEYNVSKKVDINQIAFSPELSVSPNSFDVGAEATTKTVTIESNFSWTAKTSSSWISVSKLSGSAGTTALTVNIGANTSTSSRSAYIEIYNTEYNISKRIAITQSAPSFNVTPESIEVGTEKTTKNITINSNISWSAKTSDRWINLSKSSGTTGTTTLTIDIGANTSTSSRSGYVEFYNTEYDVSKKVDISQTAFSPILNINQETFDVGGEASSVNVTIVTNVMLSVIIDGDWLDSSEYFNSVDSTTIRIDIAENESTTQRTGYVDIINFDYNISKRIIINQNRTPVFVDLTNGLNMKMIYVEGGTFAMGSNEGSDWERPVHSVTLDSYYIGETEITQAQWRAIMSTTPSSDNRPVVMVSWNDAQEFCKRLSELTGRRYVLPTEAQWEYAARGGNKSKGYTYSGSNNIDDVAVYVNNFKGGLSEVKSKQPNELGVYDMSGNAWEWCNDLYGYYNSSSQTNPQGSTWGDMRVLRGGGWNFSAGSCRVTCRHRYEPTDYYDFLGFRVVCIP